MRSKLIFLANLAIGVALFVYVIRAYGAPALHILGENTSGPLLAGFVLSALATVLVLSWRWGFVMGGWNAPLGLARLALYRSAGHTLAVLVPSGKLAGDPLRAWLAVRSDVPAAEAIGGVAVDRTLEISSSAPFSVLFAVLLLQHGIPQLEEAVVTIVTGTVAFGIGVGVAVHRLRQNRGLVTSLLRSTRLNRLSAVDSRMNLGESAEKATAELVGLFPRMAIAFAVGLLANVLVVLEFALLLWAFGLPADAIAVVAAIFAAGAAHMLPIPASVGVLEGAQVWIFQMLGYPTDVGLAVGLAVRLRELLWMAPGVVYLAAGALSGSLARARTE